MKWLVQITGDDFDLNELSKSLKDPELNLIKKDNQYYLKSIQFYQLKEASEVKDKAEEIMNIINGVSRLVIGTRNSFKVGSIVRINDDGTQTALVSFSDVAIGRDSFSATKISNDGSVETVNPADSVPGFFNIAQNSNSVATVFRLLCVKGYTWVNLY
ncbi:MAG: hypothetical protein ACRD94_08670, partial [Nitrosopumilaceae archaeon]